MNPTSFFFGALIFAFLFYITVKGDLGKWLGLLGLAQASAAPGTGQTIPKAPMMPPTPSGMSAGLG